MRRMTPSGSGTNGEEVGVANVGVADTDAVLTGVGVENGVRVNDRGGVVNDVGVSDIDSDTP